MGITKEMFLEGKLSLKEPEILSTRDHRYLNTYALRLMMDDVKSLCEILQYPSSEIFTDYNLNQISSYGSILLGKKEFRIGSHRVGDILLEIKTGSLGKNAVLHDVSKLLGKHDPEELELKVNAYNYLASQGIIKIRS